MKILVNFRPLFVALIFIVFGVLIAYCYFRNAVLAIILLILYLVALIALGFVLFLRYKKKFVGALVWVCSLLVVIVFCNFVFTVNNWNNGVADNAFYDISGVITDKSIKTDDADVVYLRDVNFNGKKVDGLFELSLTNVEGMVETKSFTNGKNVKLNSKVAVLEIIRKDKINIRRYRENVRYSSKCEMSKIELYSDSSPTFFEVIRTKVKSFLFDNMSHDMAGLAYGMLTGDRAEVPYSVNDAFNDSGLGHILAVSGLHVGFVSMIVMKLLQFLRVNKRYAGLISLILVLLYAMVVGFSPSVMRAVIMMVVITIVGFLGEEYDGLTSLSTAGCIILIISPLQMFDIGFLMSFSAVFGILLFNNAIKDAICRVKIPNFIATSIALPLSAQIGILPVQIFFFGKFQLFSLISNIFLLPFMTFSFVLLFVVILIGLVFPIVGKVLQVCEVVMTGVYYVANFFSAQKFALVNVYFSAPMSVATEISYFGISRFTNFGKYNNYIKNVMILLLSLLYICAIIVGYVN